MPKPIIMVCHWLPDREWVRWQNEFSQWEFVKGDHPETLNRAEIAYGLPEVARLSLAKNLRWLQLASAGVPHALCPVAHAHHLCVTNLAGLYGPTIAEHAIALLLLLNRQLHVVQRQQASKNWDRSMAGHMRDLHGKTLAIVGLGNIGKHIARLARALGMRVVGCKRRESSCPHVDQVYLPCEVKKMFAEADHAAIAAPLTKASENLVGLEELKALRRGACVINVSRGPIIQESALLEALRSGHLAGAGLDVFAVEPLTENHPFWTMPNVLVSPHYSGETVNSSSLPAQRFARNLRSYQRGETMEGVVNLEHGY